MLENKLKLARRIIAALPDGSALGGSLGLYLQNINVGRSLDDCDIDIVVPHELDVNYMEDLQMIGVVPSRESGSSPETMHYQMKNTCGTKIDIQVQPKCPTISFGMDIRLVQSNHTIGWKLYYALGESAEGKNRGDLFFIFHGNRETPKKEEIE